MKVFLYGCPASGKTTLGRRLAEALGWGFVDLDEEIEKRDGRTIAEIFDTAGEPEFRKLESLMLLEIVRVAVGNYVTALGGGTLLDNTNRDFCESEGVVWCLSTPRESELAKRIAADGMKRPLGNRAVERASHYASFEKRIVRSFALDDSLILVGENFAKEIIAASRFAVVDEKLQTIPGALRLAAGESNKNLKSVTSLWSAFAASGLTRKDCVTAVGGGVVGDLTGFAAATWMRGIDWINVPTTLLAMTDASCGGKTGFDLPEGKNLVGAFHSPKLVLIDTSYLKTLPEKELANGRAEMLKHSILKGGLKPLTAETPPTPEELAENLSVKIAIVKEDPLERTGRRLLLNCGHTVAHALEVACGYRLAHGECVAIGCVEEARLAVRLGLAEKNWPEELAAAFAASGLPTQLPYGVSFESLKHLMLGDKKRESGSCVRFALPLGWGRVEAIRVDLVRERVC